MLFFFPYTNTGRADWGVQVRDASLSLQSSKNVSIRVYHS